MIDAALMEQFLAVVEEHPGVDIRCRQDPHGMHWKIHLWVSADTDVKRCVAGAGVTFGDAIRVVLDVAWRLEHGQEAHESLAV